MTDAQRYHRLEHFLLRLVDVGIGAVMFAAPLLMGGRHPLGKLVFVSLVAATAVAWMARQCLVKRCSGLPCGAEWLLAGGFVLIVLQLTPLPQSLLHAVSPNISELLPMWTTAAETTSPLGQWSQLSLRPEATRSGLAMYLAYAMLFLVMVGRIRSLDDVQRTVRWLALAACSMAIVGLVQFLFGNGKFLWVYEDPFRDSGGCVKGPFYNQNHFAHFLALGVGPLIWWMSGGSGFGALGVRPAAMRMHRGARQPSSAAVGICLGAVTVAALLTFSRGGVVAILTAGAVSAALLAWLGQIDKRAIGIFGAVGAAVVVALIIYGYEPLANELRTVEQARSLDELSAGRKVLWESHAGIIQQFLWTGTGVGSHRQIYPTFMDRHFEFQFEYGESGFMQLLVETGLPGLLLLIVGIGLSVWWCAGTLRSNGIGGSAEEQRAAKACAAALLAGVTASVVHSIFDFVWYIPACTSLTVITLACACSLSKVAAEEPQSDAVPQESNSLFPARIPWFAATAITLFVGVMMIQTLLPAALAAPSWEQYIKLVNDRDPSPSDADQAVHGLQRMFEAVEETVRRNPNHDEAQLKLATICQMLFDVKQRESPNPISLMQIRDVVLASQFPSGEARDAWLSRAIGGHCRYLAKARYHARRAVQLCPLQGEAYVFLAQLTFLDPPPRRGKGDGDLLCEAPTGPFRQKTPVPFSTPGHDQSAYVEQALRVRPFSGTVLVEAGGEALINGDYERAAEHWKLAFHLAPKFQDHIIKALAPGVPAEFFLESFQPDADGLSRLFSYYRAAGRQQDARSIGRPYAAELEAQANGTSGSEAGKKWHQAFAVHRFLADRERALECIRRAVTEMPVDVGMRRALAETLVEAGRFDEAIEEIEWCIRRDPENSALRKLHSRAHQLRLSAATEARPARQR